MGIVKRLDDQKRLIDRIERELEELKATKGFESTAARESQKVGELVEALETALTINKRLADSVIKIRERLSEVVEENRKLRVDIDLLNSKGLAVPVQSALLGGALAVARTLTAGPRSSTEISRVVQQSREHTSRSVKKLLDRGLLARAGKTFPAKYALTELGRELLKKKGGPTSG